MHPYIHAKNNPDKPAYIMAGSGESISYRELDEASNRGAQFLRSLGIKCGDHLALYMENSLQFMEIVWACQRAGVIVTAISTHLKSEEVIYITGDCDAKIFVFSKKTAEVSVGILNNLVKVNHIFTSDCLVQGVRSWDNDSALLEPVPIDDESRGLLMLYSSGTTGTPKGILPQFTEGVEITEVLPLWQAMMAGLQFSEDMVYLSPAPLYHAAPLANNMLVAIAGGTSIIMDKFDAEHSLSLIHDYKVTHSQWVPIMFVRMLKLDKSIRSKYSMESMKVAIHAAAPCPVEVKQEMINWWGEILVEYYSATEGHGATMITSQQWLDHAGSVGLPMGCKLHIMDDDGNELPAGEVGNVYFSSEGPGFEYYKCPEKTKEAYNDKGDATVGDLGYKDEDGFLYLTDRADFMIISGGVNIYPQEIESAMITYEKIADVAVFGIPDEEFGESIQAVVQLQEGVNPYEGLEDELKAYCRAHLSNVKCPKSIDFVKELPRVDNGKLYKKPLREAYIERRQSN